jgi:NtrC-family two-component system sensor histidine kinase KinB
MLRSKLLLAQLPLAASFLLVIVFATRVVATLERTADEILRNNHVSVLAAGHMHDAADTLGRLALLHASGQTVAEAALARERARFAAQLRVQEGSISESGEAEATARLHAGWLRFDQALSEVIARPPATAMSLYTGTLLPALAQLGQATDEIGAINERAMLRRDERARRAAARLARLVQAASCLALIVGLLLSWRLTVRLLRPLASLSHAVQRVTDDDLDVRALVDGRDEVAELARRFNRMAQRLGEYRSSSLHELLRARRTLQAAIDGLPEAVVVLALDGQMTAVNRAATRLFDLRAGLPIAAVADVDTRAALEQAREDIGAGRVAPTPQGLDEALRLETRDGPRDILVHATPLDVDGGTIGCTVLLQDVTRLRKLDELKSDAVAAVAHEFRNPLTSLRMAVQLCTGEIAGALTAEQSELLSGADEDCDRLEVMVDELIELARIRAGRIELHKRAVSAAALLQEALELHAATARRSRIGLTIGDAVETAVLADPERAQLVLTNLVANALQHTAPSGAVELRALVAPEQIRFEVRDTGSGIPRQYVPRLFERFFRVPGTRVPGVGLGLHICKLLVEAHGGEIGVDTEVGRGSLFWFTLPQSS